MRNTRNIFARGPWFNVSAAVIKGALNLVASIKILSQRSPLICGVNYNFVVVFLLFFGVGLNAYLSNHNPFSREHIFL